MSYTFRRAIREQTSVLLALAGSSGSGKTFSALRLARGLAGEGRVVLIDTEAGRALHYADRFAFDHADLQPPFAPAMYADVIDAAEKAAYAVIIVDSMSHEWAGAGGCQDLHDAILERLAGGDERKMETMNVLAWRDPKLEHKRMVSRLLQCRAHLIFCLRAEEKIKFTKVEGKTRIEPAGWQPICEKNLMYEMTASFLLRDEAPGVPTPIKLQEQHKPCFPPGALLDEAAGARLAAWARGGQSGKQDAPAASLSGTPDAPEDVLRHEMLQEVRRLGAEKDLSPQQRVAAWNATIGEGTRPQKASLDQLLALRDALEALVTPTPGASATLPPTPPRRHRQRQRHREAP